jgi:hypothetical protein
MNWTPDEDTILIDIYAGNGCIKAQMHRLPGRTYIGAKNRAVRLNLDHKGPITDGSLSWIKAAIVIELEKGIPLSAASLCRIIGASRAGIKPVLKRWHRKGFRVAGWERAGEHGWLPKYALGDELDAPKPQPKSLRQACRDWRLRQRIATGQFNPFAAALGLVEAPKGEPGRVYIHLTDSPYDDLEEAA